MTVNEQKKIKCLLSKLKWPNKSALYLTITQIGRYLDYINTVWIKCSYVYLVQYTAFRVKWHSFAVFELL